VNATNGSSLFSAFDQPWWVPRSADYNSNGRNGFGLDDNVYQALLRNRIIFLGTEVKDENANAICAQMLLLNAEDPHKDIYLYINSPGGSVDSGMAIYDTMRWISNDVATVAMGLAASMGQFLLCAGTKGKRFALPHSRIMMHQPSGGLGGTASDIRIQAEQSLHIKSTMQKLIAEHTGQTLDQIEADSDRDRWFTADQALTYGFIDHVFVTAAQIPSPEAPNQ
jgi:ATP-dependent Clp protease protease subunit